MITTIRPDKIEPSHARIEFLKRAIKSVFVYSHTLAIRFNNANMAKDFVDNFVISIALRGEDFDEFYEINAIAETSEDSNESCSVVIRHQNNFKEGQIVAILFAIKGTKIGWRKEYAIQKTV